MSDCKARNKGSKGKRAFHLDDGTRCAAIRIGSAMHYDNRAAKFTDEQLNTMCEYFIGKGFQTEHAMEVTALMLEAYSEQNPCDDSIIFGKGYDA